MMASHEAVTYLFEGFRLDARRRILRGPDGQPIALNPKAFDTLLYFVERPGSLLDRRLLLEAIWPHVVVEENSLSQAISVLRRVLGEQPGDHRFIVTEPGRGYRFVAPVVVERAGADTAAAPPAGEPRAIDAGGSTVTFRRTFATRRVVAAALPLTLALAFAAAVWLPRDREPVLPNSIAVLPFENLSPDPDHAFVAAGLHGEILNALTALPHLNVIGQSSMLAYVGTEKSAREIGRELNVQTLLDTSVRYAGGRIRVTPMLVDADTGRNLWSATYDEEFKDVFAIESDIAMQVAKALAEQFPPAGAALVDAATADRRSPRAYPAAAVKGTRSPEAYEAYLRAQSLAAGGNTASDLVLEYLDEALRHDPNFALAHASKAAWYAGRLISQIGRDAAEPSEWAELERLVRESAATALELDPSMWLAHEALGDMHEYFWRWSEALGEFERAARSTPRGVRRRYDSRALMSDFRLDEAIVRQADVLALDPLDDLEHWVLGLSHAYSGNALAAADAFRKALTLNPNLPTFQLWFAHAEGALGNREEALEALGRAEQLPTAHRSAITIANLAYAYAMNGRREDAYRLFGLLAEKAADRRHQAGNWALAHLAIGDREAARAALETVVEKIANHEPDAGFLTLRLIRANVYADPVLEEPVFAKLRAALRGR